MKTHLYRELLYRQLQVLNIIIAIIFLQTYNHSRTLKWILKR